MRELTDTDKALKGALRLGVERLGGTTKAADLLGIDAGQLSRYCNEDHPSRPPVCLTLQADALCGEPFVLQLYAAKLGMQIVPFGVEADAACVMKTVAEFAAATGEAQSFTLRAASDGRFSPNEKRGVRERLASVASAKRQIMEMVSE